MTEDRLDTRKVQYPRKDGSSASVAGLSTPKRPQAGVSVTSSRPASPVTFETNSDVPIINPAFTQIEQHKKIARRKKLIPCPQESEVLIFYYYPIIIVLESFNFISNRSLSF